MFRVQSRSSARSSCWQPSSWRIALSSHPMLGLQPWSSSGDCRGPTSWSRSVRGCPCGTSHGGRPLSAAETHPCSASCWCRKLRKCSSSRAPKYQEQHQPSPWTLSSASGCFPGCCCRCCDCCCCCCCCCCRCDDALASMKPWPRQSLSPANGGSPASLKPSAAAFPGLMSIETASAFSELERQPPQQHRRARRTLIVHSTSRLGRFSFRCRWTIRGRS
mmetsp:Transcript_41259/g.89112  ORF Transcript_41259/g.89112 Transcript_41259/m.89112 type:complete len:219 (+) Transcript_41259:491-1147(+)